MNRLGSLKICELDILEQDNPICQIRFLESFILFRLKDVQILNGKEITVEDREKAWAQFATLKGMLGRIPYSLITRSQMQHLSYSYERRSLYQEDSDDSDLDDAPLSKFSRMSAQSCKILFKLLK